MKKLILTLVALLFIQNALAWTVVPVPGSFTAQWTDANGVARSSPANSNREVYVGNTGRYVMHNVASIADSMAARSGFSTYFYACYSALESCLSVSGQVDAEAHVQVISVQNDVLDFSLSMPPTQSTASLNLSYAVRQTFANPVIISAKTALTVYAYPTDTDLNHIFTYAKSLPQFAGAGSVQSITIPQGQPGHLQVHPVREWPVGCRHQRGRWQAVAV